MPDVHDAEARRRNMVAIRGRNTKPELVLRSALHQTGFRFRTNRTDLPGKPDIVLPKYRAVIFMHGCFWHRHNCAHFKQPGGDNANFWKWKLNRNAERDEEVAKLLSEAGWRRFVVWECAVVGPARIPLSEIVSRISAWLPSSQTDGVIEGTREKEHF